MNSTNKNLEDYQEAGVEIFHKLHLNSYPLSLKYIRNALKIIKRNDIK